MATRKIASRLNIMFVLGVILAFSYATDTKALTKRQAALETIYHGVGWCEANRQPGFVCKRRAFNWYVRHTSEVLHRRAGGFSYHRAYSTLRYAWARPNSKYGVEMGCGTTVVQMLFGLYPGPITVKCERPHKDRPVVLGFVSLAGQYY